MEFRILGALEVVDADRTLTPGGPKQRALLAVLLLAANEVVSADRLIDVLWGAHPPEGAVNALQYHVSKLRKSLGEDVIATREPGYVIRLEPEQLDLLRFERLVAEAEGAEPERAARVLRAALDLWRGEALADLTSESFTHVEARRLEELRLAALELRIEADLALGRQTQLVSELEALVRMHPLRERLGAALMRALYAAGRQADALEVYRQIRQTLSDELGLEPSPLLRELEQAILRQDRSLAVPAVATAHRHAILVVCDDDRQVDDLLALAEPLSTRPARELIITRLVSDDRELATATATLAARRDALAARGVGCRVAAYTAGDVGTDAALIAAEQQVDLVLAMAPARERLDDQVVALLDQAPCDVGLLRPGAGRDDGPVVTPFGAADHDWSAIELSAWLASSLGTTLRLLGLEADGAGRRDASRLLARASLLVQQVVGIVTEPVLISPGDRGVVEAAADARVLVLGLSDRWRAEGIGAVRGAIAAAVDAPALFVRHGPQPGGLAPPGTMTRFTWTLGAQRA